MCTGVKGTLPQFGESDCFPLCCCCSIFPHSSIFGFDMSSLWPWYDFVQEHIYRKYLFFFLCLELYSHGFEVLKALS